MWQLRRRDAKPSLVRCRVHRRIEADPTLNYEKPPFTVRTIFAGVIGRPRPKQSFLDEIAPILGAAGVVPRHKVQTPPAGANESHEGCFGFGHSQDPNPEVVLY